MKGLLSDSTVLDDFLDTANFSFGLMGPFRFIKVPLHSEAERTQTKEMNRVISVSRIPSGPSLADRHREVSDL